MRFRPLATTTTGCYETDADRVATLLQRDNVEWPPCIECGNPAPYRCTDPRNIDFQRSRVAAVCLKHRKSCDVLDTALATERRDSTEQPK